MAKKQSMNIFEAHVEKIAIVVVLVILGGVIFLRFVSPPAVDTPAGKLKASEAARKGKQLAEDAVQQIKTADNKVLSHIKSKPANYSIKFSRSKWLNCLWRHLIYEAISK